MNKLTAKTRKAIENYGFDACVKAYNMNREGDGANTIAFTGPVTIKTTRQADAAITAGREISHAAIDRLLVNLARAGMTHDQVVLEIAKENAAA